MSATADERAVPTGVGSSRPRAEAAVDLDAIRHKRGRADRTGGPLRSGRDGRGQAEGYGHGSVPVARAALAAGASWLGVCTLDEALALRAAGITAPVLSWLDLPDVDFAAGVANDVDLSVASVEELDVLRAAARSVGRRARIHLKIDTGLSRNGCAEADWPGLVRAAAEAQADGMVQVVAVWSHLAHGDEPDSPMLDQQAARLDAAWALARDAGLLPIRHLANSGAALTRPDLHYDLVRPGIAVYGLDPIGRPPSEFGLRRR